MTNSSADINEIARAAYIKVSYSGNRCKISAGNVCLIRAMMADRPPVPKANLSQTFLTLGLAGVRASIVGPGPSCGSYPRPYEGRRNRAASVPEPSGGVNALWRLRYPTLGRRAGLTE